MLSAGVWTPKLFQTLFPKAKVKIPITPLAGHSVVYQDAGSNQFDSCYAVFAADLEGFSPELFNRQGNEIWLGGLNSSSISVPELASDAQPDPEAIAIIKKAARHIIPQENLKIVRESLVSIPPCKAGICNANIFSVLSTGSTRRTTYLRPFNK